MTLTSVRVVSITGCHSKGPADLEMRIGHIRDTDWSHTGPHTATGIEVHGVSEI